MHAFDYALIIAYLAGSILLGIATRSKSDETSEYFAAKSGIGGIFERVIVGLSIAATFFSGLSFIMYPSMTIDYGLKVSVGLLCFPVSWVILRFWFWPRFLNNRYESAYDVIEERLGVSVRVTASVLFILLRISWMSALIYAPALMIIASAGLDESWLWPVVLTIGLSCTLYTTIGGIRGVITTDALQFFVMLIGIAAVLWYGFDALPVSSAEAFQKLRNNGSLVIFDFSFSLTDTITFWSIVVGFTVPTVSGYMADQMSLQRYLGLSSLSSVNRSFMYNFFGVSAVILILIAIGLVLAVWKPYLPEAALLANADHVLPYFVSTLLPPGFAGLLIAAVLAATMSSMTSGINAVSAALVYDFRKFFTSDDKSLLAFGKLSSLLLGLAATICAGFVGNLGTLFVITRTVLGVISGPLMTPMILSLARIRVPPPVVVAGLLLGLAGGWAAAFSSLSSLWAAPVSFLVSLLIPLSYAMASSFRPAR